MGRTFVCTFSVGLDDLPRKKQRDSYAVLAVLAEKRRFSVFEATANQDIANTMTRIQRSGWVTTTPVGFPWTDVELTDAGWAALGHAGTAGGRGEE